MKLRVLQCPQCGAPLPRRAALVRLKCEFCQSEVVVDRYAVKAADYREQLANYQAAPDEAVVHVGKFALRHRQRLASGHSSDVFLVERVTRLSERLVLKRLREPNDEALLRNEQRVLAVLESSTSRGATHFTTLLPQRVTIGRIDGDAAQPLAAVYREPVGFAHTLVQVSEAHGKALHPRHLVWLGRRLLELLGFVHSSGFVHGAVLPAHILIDANAHGARLIGYSCATSIGTKLGCVDAACPDLYPAEVLGARGLEPRDDVAMLARSLLWATDVGAMPAQLHTFLAQLARGEGGADAWQAERALGEVAERAFGAPRFVKLEMP